MYGARIRQVRKALGYTQQEVAHLLGMDQSTYSRWERGTTAIGAAELERIARVLKMRAETLFGKERLTVAVLTVRTEERIRELERQLAERDAEIKALREQLRRARARRT